MKAPSLANADGSGGADERPRTRAVIGFPTALASSVGLIMASAVILTATSGFGMGGGVFALAMLIAFVMMQAQATTFAEASAIIPTAGSVYDYINCGLGRLPAIMGTLSAYLLVQTFAGTAETILCGTMALVNFPGLNAVLAQHGTSWLLGVALLLIFSVTNIFGIRLFGKLEIFVTSGMWLSLMAFGIAGLIEAPAVHFSGWFAPSTIGTDSGAVLSLVGLAMFMFVGAEFVTPLAPEMKRPARNIPLALTLGLTMVAVCMLLYGMAMQRQVANVPVDAQGMVHLLDTPGAIPVFAERIAGPYGRIWFGVAFLFAAAATLNTLMAGLPRILYGMAVDGALPRVFAYLHPKYKTPVVAIAFAAAIPAVYAWCINGNLDRITPLVLAAVCSWGVGYILVTLSVVVLRIRRPDLPRPYKSPLFPLPQIISTVGIVIAILYTTPRGMNPRDIYLPFGLMLALAGVFAAVWTLLVKRVRPFTPVSVELVLERSRSADGP